MQHDPWQAEQIDPSTDRGRQRLAELRASGEVCDRALFPTSGAEVLLFRIARAAPPTARSLRRHLDEVLDLA